MTRRKNHGDPNLYLATHPLGPKTPDMHWGWTAGYRFMAIEGYVDNNNDGIPEQNFQIHSLGDELLFTTFLDVSASQKITTDPFVINLDYVKLFNAISMSGNIIQHGSGTLNKNMLLNAANAGFISPQIILSSQDEVKLESIASFNQNNRSLNINFNDVLSSKNVIIYSQSGQMVFSEKIENAVFNHELSEVSSGNYVITIIDGEKWRANKFLFAKNNDMFIRYNSKFSIFNYIVISILLCSSCNKDEEGIKYDYSHFIPSHFPIPISNPDSIPTEAQFTLGKNCFSTYIIQRWKFKLCFLP
ncbi:MAG: T9SS type A sorting domain-containing protein [Saprospiraceae bacterium]|nr:T9SS type A sorting domain-containing protein [Saprospiraceae bacterium]